MKTKILSILISAAAAAYAFAPSIFAESEITVTFNGDTIGYDTNPIITDGVVFLPLRQTLEECGFSVRWDAFSSSVTAQNGDTSIIMVMGGRTLLKNGIRIYSESAPQLINDSAMIPAQTAADCLGLSVNWDSEAYTLEYTGGSDTNGTDSEYGVRDIREGDFSVYTGDTIVMKAGGFESSQAIWTSSNSKIASVSEDGVVTANSPGTADIAVYNAAASKIISCRVTVELAIRPSFASESISVNSKEKADIGLRVNDGYSGADLDWHVEDENVCIVSSDGTVTGINGGTTTVRAVSPTGHYAEVSVTVIQPCSSIKLTDSTIIINDSNNGFQLTAVMTPDTANEKITWTSEDTEYLQVDENGVVTAYQSTPKYYKITAKTASGKVAVCKAVAKITAAAADIEIISIRNGADESTTRVNGSLISSYGEPLALTITNNSEAAVSINPDYHYSYIKRGNNKIYAVPVNPESTSLSSLSSNLVIKPGDTETVYFAEYGKRQNAGLVMESDDILNFRFTCSGIAYWCYVSRSGSFYFEKD